MTNLEWYFAAMREWDEGGLPTHCPFPLTKDGRGPATGDDFHHWACWCPDAEKCKVVFDLAWAALLEVRDVNL